MTAVPLPPHMQDRECHRPLDLIPHAHHATTITTAIRILRQTSTTTDQMAHWMRLHDAIDTLTDALDDAHQHSRVADDCGWAGTVELVHDLHDNHWDCPRCRARHREDK